MAKSKGKQGAARMAELGKAKAEVWFTESQMVEVRLLAAKLNMPIAKLVRRAVLYAARGGYQALHCLTRSDLD